MKTWATSRSSWCSGVQGRVGPEPPNTGSLTVWGCSPGSGTVELRTFSGNRLLASITITVERRPTPTPVTPTATPPVVSSLTSTASTTSVRLSWDDLDGAAKYRVEHRLSTSTSSWSPVETTGSAHTVASLTPGTSYAFKVRAYGDGTKYKAAWGAEAATTASTMSTGTVALVKPPPPSGLETSAPTDTTGRVTLTWSRLNGADKYEVEYRRSGSAQGQGGGAQGQSAAGNWVSHDDDIAGTGPTITHHVDGLTCDQSHDFRVRSHGDSAAALYLDDWGDDWSATVSETPHCGATEPTATPTQEPNSVPSFAESSTSVVFAEGVFASRTLPKATGGDGTLTYSVSPALGNDLTLNQPSDTEPRPSVSGNPLQAVNTVAYTYSVRDRDGDTASMELRVTVFDVFIEVRAPTGVGHRWTGLGGSRWWVAEHLQTRMHSGIASPGAFRFRLRIPASTGFQVNSPATTGYRAAGDTCVWPHPTTANWSVWVADGDSFPLVRCALGSGGSAGIEIQVEERTLAGLVVHDLDTVPMSMPKALHLADHRVRYHVPASSNALLDRGSSVYALSAAPWAGVSPGMVSLIATNTSANVTVEIGTDVCGDRAACVQPYHDARSHLTRATIYVEDRRSSTQAPRYGPMIMMSGVQTRGRTNICPASCCTSSATPWASTTPTTHLSICRDPTSG